MGLFWEPMVPVECRMMESLTIHLELKTNRKAFEAALISYFTYGFPTPYPLGRSVPAGREVLAAYLTLWLQQ